MGMGLEDLEVLQLAETIADELWQQVSTWKPFPKDTVGRQLTRSVDSIGANIAESFGRFHYGEKIQFLYYARGSLFETKYWLNRCVSRELLSSPALINEYATKLTNIARQLNGFARHLKSQKHNLSKTTIRESQVEYHADSSILFTEGELTWISQTSFETGALIFNH
jgi:four helix bundle protein